MTSKISELLREAKKVLPTDEREGICSAIHSAYVLQKNYSSRARCEALSTINERLGSWQYAHHWLGAQVLFGKHPLRSWKDREKAIRWANDQPTEAIQAWRHAWLDQLIEEFEAKGD
jgi:hypothetical protein